MTIPDHAQEPEDHAPEDMPHFASEQDLADWFEHADLSQYRLDEALEVVLAVQVELAIDEPWAVEAESMSSSNAATKTRPPATLRIARAS